MNLTRVNFYINRLNQHLKNLKKGLVNLGPAFFIIGYVTGTGSVTSMVIAGSEYGMHLIWAVLLSCFFSYFLITGISKLTIVSGNSLIYNFKIHFNQGWTIFIIIALSFSIVSSIMGVMGVMVEVLVEWIYRILPGKLYISYLFPGIGFFILLYTLFLSGKHQNFLKAMSYLVMFMGISFIITSLMVVKGPEIFQSGFISNLPEEKNPFIVIAGMVGTTMASVVLVSRSMLVQEQGWKLEDIPAENRDAAFSMALTFIVSAAIMACAAGTLFLQGQKVESAIDMVIALEPLAGELAMTIFALGIVAAGLSSIFPNMLLFPWLLTDYWNVPRDMTRNLFKIIVFFIASTSLVVPIFGGEPIWILVASQALSPLLMPLLTLLLIILLNKKSLMGKHTIGIKMNVALGATLVFNLYMLYVAIQGFIYFT